MNPSNSEDDPVYRSVPVTGTMSYIAEASSGGVSIAGQECAVDPDENWGTSCSVFREELHGVTKGTRKSLMLQLPLREVIDRVKHFMKSRSIAAKLRPPQGEILCESLTQLRFSIILVRFQERTKVLLERRRGCGIQMQLLRRDFLNFFSTRACRKERRSATGTANFLRMMCPGQKIDFHCEEGNALCEQEVIRCKCMLGSKFLYHQRNGLELLHCMMNRNYVKTDVAMKVSTGLVFDEGECSEELRERILLFLRPSSYVLSSKETEAKGIIVNTSLRVLERALEIAVGCNGRVIDGSRFWQEVMGALNDHVGDFDARPNDAAAAVNCLLLITKLNPRLCHDPLRHGILVNVSQAREYGSRMHSKLEEHSTALIAHFLNETAHGNLYE